MSIDNDLDNAEATLMAQLAQVRAKKASLEQFDNDWTMAIEFDKAFDIAKTPAFLTVLEFYNKDGEVILEFSKDCDLSREFSRKYTAVAINPFAYRNRFRMKVEAYRTFRNDTPDFTVKYSIPELEDGIAKWEVPPPFVISLDDNYGKILIKTSGRVELYELRSMPGCVYYNLAYHLPLTESWRLYEWIMKHHPTSTWDDDMLEYAKKQVEGRTILDIIAQQEVATNPIVMNGMKFHDYQSITVDFVEARGGSAIIAHEMGLGKTPISIALTERLIAANKSKHLIVCPASLVPNWKAQIKKWCGANVYTFNTEKPMNVDVAHWLAGASDFNYFIISYDALSTVTKIPERKEVNAKGETIRYPADTKQFWVEMLNMSAPSSITIDEGHYIKSVDSNRSKAVRDLISDRKIILTGTPLLNRPPELWPLIKVIDPELAGGFETFVKAYTVDGKSAKNVDELRETLKSVMFRKIKSQVMKELPPINRIIREYELSGSAKSAYNKALEGLWMELDDWDGASQNVTSINGILAQIMKLKQICAYDMISNTVELANDCYEQSEGNNRKVLIFSQFVNKPETCKEICDRLNITARALGEEDCAIYFTGAQSPQERQDMVKEFTNNPNIHYLVASTKAASEGLDITAAGSVIFHDLMWTPAAHHQAEGRAYGRMSDAHSINSYYTIAINTIMQDIMILLERKLEIFNAVIEGAELSRQDVSIAMEVIKNLKDNRKKLK